jgi:LuxR family maltose regulon positive regulatory protein
MADRVVETKLLVPRARREAVSRLGLAGLLERAADAPVTLVSAPAGFGKTTLLAEWLATRPSASHAAWLSIDPTDNDPAVFWTYLIAALQTAVPALGVSASALLESPQTPIEEVVTTLLNELTGLSDDIVLVLDDYHLANGPRLQAGVAFLIEHLPPQLHLVIGTRSDPALPLARLRAGGKLFEIRAADLRFTPAEAADYLNGVMGLGLTARDVAALEARTEGWIAALQLAAISMQGRDDTSTFIAGFAGDDRYIVDYLIEEVLARQPEAVRTFLLRTSLLDRLTGSLSDAVTGEGNGKAMLEALDRGNLFLVPLDDRRTWYRYHHLFGDVLRARLLDEQPERVPELHHRASVWYEQNGQPPEAIRHAIAADDLERAADLVELAVPAMRRNRQEATLLGWLQVLPEDVVRRRPVLSVHYAGTLLLAGKPEGADAWLRDAENLLDARLEGSATPGSTGMVVVDQEEFRALPSSIATFRAAHALVSRDAINTMQYARLALELAPEGDHLRRGPAAGLLGLAYWRTGDLEAAHRWYSECLTSLFSVGYLADTLGVAISLADLRIEQGRLNDALRTYEQALERTGGHGGPAIRGTPDMHVGMAGPLIERNDLVAANRHLVTSQELGEHLGLEQNRYRSRLALARMAEARGDPDAALDLLDEAGRQHVSDFLPNLRPVAALKARIWVAQGRLAEAQAWARDQELSAEDDLSYLREFEHITLARVLLGGRVNDRAGGAGHEAVNLLERLLRAAESGGRAGSVIQILALQALAHQADGDVASALAVLERALSLAEPEGYIRTFVDEGPAMAALLNAAAREGIAPGYVHGLLVAFGQVDDGRRVKQALIEPLSERELEVLRFLGSDLDGPEIAGELNVSLNTLRSHTKNIYAKLGVNSRRTAVSRAAELGLIPGARDR